MFFRKRSSVPTPLSLLSIAALLIFLSVPLGCPKKEVTPDVKNQGVASAAQTFLNHLISHRYAEATAMFAPAMTEAMNAKNLETTFAAVETGLGQPVKAGEAIVTMQGDFWSVEFPLEGSEGNDTVRVVLDKDSKVSGLWFAGGEKAAASQPSAEDVVGFPVSTGAQDWPLPGRITLPDGKGPFPCVVLVHGSGPHDMDETIGPNKPFLDIAKGLQARGIATLRYAKRSGVPEHAAKLMQMTSFTVMDETIDDAAAAVLSCRSHAQVANDQVFVLGHSLGGMMIPRIAKETPLAAGYVILGGNTRRTEELIVEQVEYIASLPDSPMTKEQIADLKGSAKEVKALTAADKDNPAKKPFGIPASYWLDLDKYKPAEEIKNVDKPILALHGGRDYQVTDKDFAGWTAALTGKKGAMLKRYADLNHLFMSGAGKAVPDEYKAAGKVSSIVLDDVAAFVRGAIRK